MVYFTGTHKHHTRLSKYVIVDEDLPINYRPLCFCWCNRGFIPPALKGSSSSYSHPLSFSVLLCLSLLSWPMLQQEALCPPPCPFSFCHCLLFYYQSPSFLALKGGNLKINSLPLLSLTVAPPLRLSLFVCLFPSHSLLSLLPPLIRKVKNLVGWLRLLSETGMGEGHLSSAL